MKLAICTDVFADLSYTDMLDKVKSLGIDAVEMTAGGWGARKHCNTAELLADAGKRKEFMAELEKRGIEHIAIEEFPGTMVWSGLLRPCSSCVRLPTRCSASTSTPPT